MSKPLTDHAASAASISLIAFCACVACMIPPLNERIIETPLLVVIVGLAIAASLMLHLVFVGILARSLGRSAAKYVAIALFTLPIGSIVGLVLLEWQTRLVSQDQPPSAA